MASAKQTLDQQFLEMRWRLLSLAADFDRIQRSAQGKEILRDDPRVGQLREAIELLLKDSPNRAEQLQMIFSDQTPPPTPNQKLKIENQK